MQRITRQQQFTWKDISGLIDNGFKSIFQLCSNEYIVAGIIKKKEKIYSSACRIFT
jgi:flagellar motor switch protein FliG